MKKLTAVLLMVVAGGCERHQPRVRAETGPAAVAFSADGLLELDARGLDFLVELGADLRRLAGAPIEGATRRQLAFEAFCVLGLAHGPEVVPARDKEELLQRVLAQVYLRRLIAELDRLPVQEEQIEQTYRLEMRRAVMLEGSEIFQPERIDAAAALVGYFPDLQAPERGETSPFEKRQLRELAQEIYRRAVGRRTLDEFIELVRGLMPDRPMLHLRFFWQLPVRPEPDYLDRMLHQALVALSEDGAVGEPVEADFGFIVPFRVGGRAGKGENLDQVRQQVEQLVREQRRKVLVQEHLNELLRKYQAKKLHERIWPQAALHSGTD